MDTIGRVGKKGQLFARSARHLIGIKNERGKAVYQKGYHHTEEEKEKIRQAKLGNKNPMFGKRLSTETRAKMSKSRTGKLHWAYGKPVPEERINRQKEALQKYYTSPEGIALKRRLSALTVKTKPRLGSHTPFSPEARFRMKAVRKKQWQNPEFRDKTIRASRLGSNVHPNKPEIYLQSLLDELYPNGWSFVGDGTLIIGGKNPDFAHMNGKKQLIEVFGDFWHSEQVKGITREQEERDRINLFREYGYSTLIIWESELNHPDRVKEKIVEFAGVR